MERKLQPGDKVYAVTTIGSITSVMVIDRVTKTQAVSNNMKFYIDVSPNGYVSRIGSDRGSMVSYQVESDELIRKVWRQKAVEKLRNQPYGQLSDDVLKKLLEIIEPC